LEVLDKQFGYAGWKRGREREKAKTEREGVREREAGKGERERKRGDCLVMLSEQFGLWVCWVREM
jgi:hypothetical protein